MVDEENRSPNYAPTVFAQHPDAEGLKKGRLEDAMNRLLKEGRIKIELRAKSKERSRLVPRHSDLDRLNRGSK